VDSVGELARPAAGRWTSAARHGLADPVLARAARDVFALAADALHRTDLTPDRRQVVLDRLNRLTGTAPTARRST
jgi:glutamate--cysteine ligase